MPELFDAPVPEVIIRERVEWTVANATNSSFKVLDSLGGMKRGKVEISKSTIAVLDGYDSHKWIVAFSNGTKEEFLTKEAMAARFNAEDISDPHPDADFVDWKIDILSETSGVVALIIHKELKDGTVDPEQPWNKQVVSVSGGLVQSGIAFINHMPDDTESSNVLSGNALSNFMGFWVKNGIVQWGALDWTSALTKILQLADNPAHREAYAKQLHKLLKEFPDS